MKEVNAIAAEAKMASVKMALLEENIKNESLLAIARNLEINMDKIISANNLDLAKAVESNLASPLLKRLEFGETKIRDTIKGVRDLAKLRDPVGITTYHCELDRGLNLYRVTCPLGVVAVIFESRPDALVQISTLCLKSSNAIILKGGSEAANTNIILKEIIEEAGEKTGLPQNWINIITQRSHVRELLDKEEYIDLIIPRGSNEFVKEIMSNTRIPVLGHADGVCHLYIDEYADIDMAIDLAVDGKTQYTAVCNATETILVHEKLFHEIIDRLQEAFEEKSVEIFGDEIIVDYLKVKPVKNWHWEYLDNKISVKIVKSIEDAVEHINKYGSGHTDSIVTSKDENARYFLSAVDSGNVFWNCSTRFSDGYRYGFGAEVGVSTSKIHARGPVGLDGMVTYKYKLFGEGQKVGDYAAGRSSFRHIQKNRKSPFDA